MSQCVAIKFPFIDESVAATACPFLIASSASCGCSSPKISSSLDSSASVSFEISLYDCVACTLKVFCSLMRPMILFNSISHRTSSISLFFQFSKTACDLVFLSSSRVIINFHCHASELKSMFALIGFVIGHFKNSSHTLFCFLVTASFASSTSCYCNELLSFAFM